MAGARWAVALSLLLAVCAFDKDPYRVLGINRRASADEIKAAYRKLAKKYHPDKNPDDDAQQKFLDIGAAHELLSDAKQKSDYDRYGHNGAPQQNNFDGFRGFSRRGGFNSRWNEYKSQKSFPNSNAVKLTGDNFEFRVQDRGRPDEPQVWLIFVFGSYCSLCKRVSVEFENAASSLGPFVGLGKVHSDYENGLSRQLGVHRIPTVVGVLFHKGKRTITSLRTKNTNEKSISDFAGEMFGKVQALRIAHGTMQHVSSQLQRLDRDNQGRVRVVVVGRQSNAHVLWHALAATLKDEVALSYVCFTHGQHSDSASLFRFSMEDRQRYLEARGSLVIVRREDGSPDELLGAPLKDMRKMARRLRRKAHMYVPKLDGSNFFELCYRGSSVSRKALREAFRAKPNKRTGKFSRSQREARLKALAMNDSRCLVLFASSQKEASRTGLALLQAEMTKGAFEKASGGDGTQGGGSARTVQIGWVNPADQTEFVAFLSRNKKEKARLLEAVYLLAPSSQFAVYGAKLKGPGRRGRGSADLASWLMRVHSEESELTDGLKLGGLPFLRDPPKSWLKRVLDDLSENSSQASLILGFVMVGAVLILSTQVLSVVG